MKKKLWIFKGLAIISPIPFLLFVEAVLRLFAYGHNTDLFIRYPDDTSKWVMNKYASERFFSDTVNATKGSIEPFDVRKAPNALRIFVLGESTTAGYPYFHNGSFHRWLLYRLMHTFPDKKIEIINLSLTAVNSYTVLDFAKQLEGFQPDAVLVYVGHNEYYGALGVASTSNIGSSYNLVQTALWLRKFRLVQLFDNFINKFKSSSSRNAIDTRENLMKRMAAKQEIPFGSDDYKKGISQFENNMDRMCKVFAVQHIPVFISTLVSNEKDLKPFISTPLTNPRSADKEFADADSAAKKNNYRLAKKLYVSAKEFDQLRFRAPEAMNVIIKKLAVSYPDVHIVDSRAVFEKNSPNGILGKETLLEHVHPNLYGYALLSEAFYRSLKQYYIIKPDTTQEIPFAALLKEMPVTKVDSLYGAYQVMMLKSQWPFAEKINAGFKPGSSIEEQIAGPLSVNQITWAQAQDYLFKYAMKVNDKQTALKATEAVLLENPGNLTYYNYSGRLSYESGDFKNAAFYFKKAYNIDPSFSAAQTLYMFYVKCDQPENALPYLNLAIDKNTTAADLTSYKNILVDLVQRKQQLQSANGNIKDIRLKIAADYQQFNEAQLATKYLQN